MPVSEIYGRRPRLFDGDYQAGLSFFDGLVADPGRPECRASLSADTVLAAVRAMDEGQRRELAGLLGVEARHPLLYLPSTSGGFTAPETGTSGSGGSALRRIWRASEIRR